MCKDWRLKGVKHKLTLRELLQHGPPDNIAKELVRLNGCAKNTDKRYLDFGKHLLEEFATLENDSPAMEKLFCAVRMMSRFNFGLARGNVVPDRWTGDRIQRVELDRETIYRQQNVAMNPANKPANKPAAKKAVAKKAAAKKSANKPANKPAAKTAVAWL